MKKITHLSMLFVAFAILAISHRAWAVPAFARKYKTSCVTCHTIFPKLTPFGEQFRRNGFRFPGVDSDFVKAEPVALGQDTAKQMFPDAVWPASLSPFPPLALGFNGQAVMHPDRGSSGGAADNGSLFNLDTLLEEGHIWAAGSVDDSISYYGELTFATDGSIDFESAALYFNDLIGPKHAVNLDIGKRAGSLTSFQNHGSYFADAMLPAVPVTGMYGVATSPFLFTDNHASIEANGVVGCRFNYALGVAAGGSNTDATGALTARNSANFYGHIGYKIGGSTLDGEITGNVPQDLAHEQSLTLDGFAYRSISRFYDGTATAADPTVAPSLVKNTSLTLGGAARFQWAEFEFDTGAFYQTDDHASATSPSISTLSQWNEASYLLFPWLAVGGRVEYLQLTPDGGSAVWDLRVVPGIVALVRPNIKLTLTGSLEQANGAPDLGWGAAGLSAAPADVASKVSMEVESVTLQFWSAF